jgi:AcrR family transcriptional regulator
MISNKTADRSDASLHRQKRALLTRLELLDSARAIFARDGLEHARIEDIALKAGKTRGAFYDNFKDKEDVFFAIFEENIHRDLAQLGPMLLGLPTVELRVEALAEYLCELSKDRERVLLNLEFKLYAIRHPRKRKRLAALHRDMRLRGSIPELNRLLPEVVQQGPGQRLSESLAICGMLDGLALHHLFDPSAFDDRELAHYMKLCLSETLNASPRRKFDGKTKRRIATKS